MHAGSFNAITRRLNRLPSRRDILRGLAGMGLGLGLARLPDLVVAKKKRKRKRKNKNKCGKAGGKPVKGKCCKRSIRVDGRCQRCDVCARGCAYATVQAAIDAAAAGDTIALCPGTYREYLAIDGFFGTATPLRLVGAGDGDGASDTIVQGSGDAPVVYIAANVISLEHLRITGGRGLAGGGISNNYGTVELIGCTVTENEADLGGGIFNAGGTVELIDCTVSRNTGASDSRGGGIYNQTGTLTLRNSTVSENEASVGGGLSNAGTLNLIASDISGNRAGYGGGIYTGTNDTMTADAASRIRANTATISGGGIHNEASTVTLASSAIVSDNSPTNCGGPTAVANCIG